METMHGNWCNLAAGALTPDLVKKLEQAAELARAHHHPDLAEELSEWAARIHNTLQMQSGTLNQNEQSELWLG